MNLVAFQSNLQLSAKYTQLSRHPVRQRGCVWPELWRYWHHLPQSSDWLLGVSKDPEGQSQQAHLRDEKPFSFFAVHGSTFWPFLPGFSVWHPSTSQKAVIDGPSGLCSVWNTSVTEESNSPLCCFMPTHFWCIIWIFIRHLYSANTCWMIERIFIHWHFNNARRFSLI